MKIGVLYPRSSTYPEITADFIDGLKSALKRYQLTNEVQLIMESVDFGGIEKEVYGKAEKLLILDEADILVAYIDEKVTAMLPPLLQSTGKLMLVVNSGANYPESWVAQPNMIRLNLQDAFLCYRAGKLAGQQKNKRGLVASTFYDCGYLHLASMVNGFTNSGGEVAFNYINRQQGDEVFHINELTAFLDSENAANNLLCVFGPSAASSLYKELNSYKDAGNLHLFVSPMMLEPSALEKSNAFKFSIAGYLPWMASLENRGNTDFISAWRNQSKKEASLFSLLGWESGMVLKEIFTNCKEGYGDGTAITAALAQVKMNGPRGELKLDPGTNYFITPFLKCSIKNKSKPVIEPVSFPLAGWEEYIQQPTGGAHSGWTNTYLCY